MDQGKIMVQRLIEMIEARRNKTALSPAVTIILQPELVIRKSSAGLSPSS
jgi:DNA-binding LacI/PurR family transcriptional regulator